MEQHQLLNIHMEGAGAGRQALCEGFICYNHSWVGQKQSQEKVRGEKEGFNTWKSSCPKQPKEVG